MRTGRIVSIWKCDKCGAEAEGCYYIAREYNYGSYNYYPVVEAYEPDNWWVTTEDIFCEECKP